MLTRSLSRQLGFSLMELAVVLVIVALLLGGLLVPFGTQRDVEFMRATEKSLIDIREALIGFAAVNGRLPCPAQATIASGATNAGMEAISPTGTITTATTCACSATANPGVATYNSGVACSTSSNAETVTGVLPWATLGLLETDAWGNRFTYQMTYFFGRGANPASGLFGSSCTPSTTPTSAAFALCTPGGITILTAASGGTTLASAVPAVVISHGGNALGAYNTLGTKLSTSGATTDELENTNGSVDANFVSNTTIDDRLIWISTPQLMNRMMTAGKLP